jgi:hypothetical protein
LPENKHAQIAVTAGLTNGNSAPLRYCATDATKYYDLTTTSAVRCAIAPPMQRNITI